MSKGYTINFFVNTLAGTTNTQIINTGVYNVIAPRYGVNSVKADTLDAFLGYGGAAADVAAGRGQFANLGKTPRTRLLRALKNRKKNGALLI